MIHIKTMNVIQNHRSPRAAISFMGKAKCVARVMLLMIAKVMRTHVVVFGAVIMQLSPYANG